MRVNPARPRLAALVALTVLTAFTSSARANNFIGASWAGGANGCVQNMADNGSHYVWYESLTSTTIASLNDARTDDYNPTDMNTYDEDIKTSQTDVVAYDYDYESTICGYTWIQAPGGDGIFGYSRCMVVVPSNGKCDQFWLNFDNDFMGPENTSNELHLACHEFGHSTGLMHVYDNFCMQAGRGHIADLTPHDVARLNANY